jgi:hypothetical protein
MALTGSLQDFNLFSIFTMIKSQNKIGTLLVENDSVAIKIIFDQGAIVGVFSDCQDIEKGIPRMLLRLGIISNEELENMLKIHSQTLKSMKSIALEYGAITLENIQDIYQMQAMAIIYNLFLWTAADYRFDSIVADDIDGDAFLPIPIESVLMETAKFIDEWPRVQKLLPDYSQALAKTGKTVGAAGSLTHEDGVVMGYFEHPNSIQDAIALSRYYELETCKCIASLLERGYLEICDQIAVSPQTLMQGISDIQKGQMHFSQGYSPFFWPLLAICAIVPIFSFAPKVFNDGINLGLSAICGKGPVPANNWQTEERQALVSILKNANTEHENLAVSPSQSQNSIIVNTAKDAFEKYDADPMQSLLLNERRESRR